MMHIKEAADILGLAKSNEARNLAALCREGRVAGAEYISPGWRVPEEWVYKRVLQRAATAKCPTCGNKALSIVPHEDVDQARIICISCGMEVSPREFAEIKMVEL